MNEFDAAIGPNDRPAVQLGSSESHASEARDLLLPRLVSGELDLSELDLDGALA